MAHKTLIGGTAYEIGGGRTLIGGTGYKVEKGRTLIGGTGYEVSFGGAIPITNLPVGTVIKLTKSGAQKNFIIINHGIPSSSSLYDSSCNGAWILAQDIYDSYYVPKQTNVAYSNAYADSTLGLNAYCNGTVFSSFSSGVQSLIKQVKIPYFSTGGLSSMQVVSSGSNGLSVKCFLLSVYEYGSTTGKADGAASQYFAGLGTSATDKRIAYYNGAATAYATRSAFANDSSAFTCITAAGATGKQGLMTGDKTIYIRIACVLNNTATVFSVPNADGSYNLIA